MGCQESFITGDDGDSLGECSQNQGSCGFDSSDEFHHDVHPVDGFFGRGGQEGGGDLHIARGIEATNENLGDVHTCTGTCRKIVILFPQNADHLRSDRSGSQDSDAQRALFFEHVVLPMCEGCVNRGGPRIFCDTTGSSSGASLVSTDVFSPLPTCPI